MLTFATQEWTKACFEELVAIGLSSPAISTWTSSFSLDEMFAMPASGDPSIYSMKKQAACSYLEGTDQPWGQVWVGNFSGALRANVIRDGYKKDTDDGWDWVPISVIQGVNSPMRQDPTSLPPSLDNSKQVWWRDPIMLIESEYDTPYGAFSIGNGSVVTSTGTALGSLARVWNSGSVAIGYSSLCGASSKCYNPLNNTEGAPASFDDVSSVFRKKYRQSNSTAVGAYTQAGPSCTSIGAAALSWMENGTAVGAASSSAGTNATAVGQASAAGGNYSTAIGGKASAATQYATAIGYKAAVSGDGYCSNTYGPITSSDAHGTTEQNMSVALGAYSVVPQGETDVVSVGNSDVDVFTKNYFNGVNPTSSNSKYTERPWNFNTDSDVKTSLYRRIINVADPINEHDAVTLGYLMKQQIPTLTKTDGVYPDDEVKAYIDSIKSQTVTCTADFRNTTYQSNQDWMLYTQLADQEIGSISNLSPNYGIFWHRDAVMKDGSIVWIDGLDDLADKPEGTDIILRKPLTFNFKTETKKLTGITTINVTTIDTDKITYTTLSDGTKVPLQPLMRWKLPKYVGKSTAGEEIQGIATGYDKYTHHDMVLYIQLMWILTKAKYCMSRNMGSNAFLDKTITLADPNAIGYEYGTQMSACIAGTDLAKILPIIPEGTPFYLNGKSSDGTAYDQVRVEVQMTWDIDETYLEAMLDNTFEYAEGDTWTLTGAPFLTGSVTHGADGWQQASTYNSAVLGKDGYMSFMKQDELFMDVAPYKIGGVEVGIAPLASDITIARTQDWTKYADYEGSDTLVWMQSKYTLTSPYGSSEFESIQSVVKDKPRYNYDCNVLLWLNEARTIVATRLNTTNGQGTTGLVTNGFLSTSQTITSATPTHRETTMQRTSWANYNFGNLDLFTYSVGAATGTTSAFTSV